MWTILQVDTLVYTRLLDSLHHHLDSEMHTPPPLGGWMVMRVGTKSADSSLLDLSPGERGYLARQVRHGIVTGTHNPALKLILQFHFCMVP